MVVPDSVPLFLFVVLSAAVVPVPSSNFQYAEGPVPTCSLPKESVGLELVVNVEARTPGLV
jgi:hypothetical protein